MRFNMDASQEYGISGNLPLLRCFGHRQHGLWVLAVTADPVTSGFASSLSRLGGNITGISRASDEGARHAGLAGCTPGSHRANRQENWPIIVSLANGIDNQRILPKLFSKVIYGVVVHNARRDAPVIVGFNDKGPLLIGTLDNKLGAELEMVRSILARGCPTEIVDRMQDAIHTKIVINLTNALDALVGRGWRPLSDFAAYQQLLSQTLWEGVRIMRAAGFRERRIPGLPSFALIGLMAGLPGWATRPLFRRRLRAMNMSSMTQDVALRGAHDTELEPITGYVVELAARHGVPAPYNRAIYRLGLERFRPGFEPLPCQEVLAAVEEERAAQIAQIDKPAALDRP
jgi:2-dehydropantoate 2-reductase